MLDVLWILLVLLGHDYQQNLGFYTSASGPNVSCYPGIPSLLLCVRFKGWPSAFSFRAKGHCRGGPQSWLPHVTSSSVSGQGVPSARPMYHQSHQRQLSKIPRSMTCDLVELFKVNWSSKQHQNLSKDVAMTSDDQVPPVQLTPESIFPPAESESASVERRPRPGVADLICCEFINPPKLRQISRFLAILKVKFNLCSIQTSWKEFSISQTWYGQGPCIVQ